METGIETTVEELTKNIEEATWTSTPSYIKNRANKEERTTPY